MANFSCAASVTHRKAAIEKIQVLSLSIIRPRELCGLELCQKQRATPADYKIVLSQGCSLSALCICLDNFPITLATLAGKALPAACNKRRKRDY